MIVTYKLYIRILGALILLGFSPFTNAEWRHAIGTGLAATSLDGDIGFDTTTSGPVMFSIDLDNSEYSDLVESGFGFVGVSAKDKWKIGYILSNVTIEDSDGAQLYEWDRSKIEVAAGYNFATTGDHNWGGVFGLRNISHEWQVTVGGTEVVNIDESWTDVVLGLGHNVPIAEGWTWANLLQVTFGDSEGTSSFNTAVAWQAYENWNFSLALNFENNEFLVGQPGDANYYSYDVSEPTIALSFLYMY